MAKRSDNNRGGRPPKYADAEELTKRFTDYFKHCDENRQMPNKAGLCIWLGIHKDTYNEYKKKAGFSDALKACEAMIENAWVQRLSSNAPTGAIFYLKNAFKDDYREKQEVDHTTAGQPALRPPGRNHQQEQARWFSMKRRNKSRSIPTASG